MVTKNTKKHWFLRGLLHYLKAGMIFGGFGVISGIFRALVWDNETVTIISIILGLVTCIKVLGHLDLND